MAQPIRCTVPLARPAASPSRRDLARARFVYENARCYTDVEIFSAGAIAVKALGATSPQTRAECEESFEQAIEQNLNLIRFLFGSGSGEP